MNEVDDVYQIDTLFLLIWRATTEPYVGWFFKVRYLAKKIT